MSAKYFSSFLLASLLVSCGHKNASIYYGRDDRIHLDCMKGKVEVGLYAKLARLPDKHQGVPSVDLPIKSKIEVLDVEAGDVLVVSESDFPVVAWIHSRAEGRMVEYLGLQEIQMPSSLFCREYEIRLEYEDASKWFASYPEVELVPYARRAMRP